MDHDAIEPSTKQLKEDFSLQPFPTMTIAIILP